ncbi:D-alanyl-D-alanine carboxypeptidase/D-alanyl-D-alanine endopeptidase [Legionella nagasakiensis]|uniref:D-alanyl-D-alanine carboxypeptidase/D-alanyl-D-alanine endopeptidase n=1 Tax=Legionella nagasakiensis TaxID=535290 RepID=UPI00105612AE|nr:D-alanyl-D-alanine carboxypeptidase/D-alanyl-D-alanine-endopeptidase [Legionella nagasakiensis]
MKRILSGLLLGFMAAVATAANLQKSVDKLIDQVDPAINIGIVVTDLNTGETLYQRNPKRAFIPASNMKLFSDAAALLILGPDYRFQSQLSTNATLLENGTLKGSIYLYLPGDPSFSQTHLADLLGELPTWGIKRIEGNVVLVSNNRYVNAYAPGWMIEDLKYSYGAPVAPVIIDENRLTVTVNPAYQPDRLALVEVNNRKNDHLLISNQVKTKSSAAGCGVDFNMDQDNRLTARGCVGLNQWAIQQRLAIRNPLRYAQALIKQQLADLHIELDGQVVLGNMPTGALLLATHDSKPIAQLMADTLKPSDNLYADSLFLHAAAKLQGAPLNWKQAQSVLKAFLQNQTGVSLDSAVLTDGSGLSRYDQLTPDQTVGLLRFLHTRFPLAYEYIAALPVAGHDGTLQKRFRKPEQQGLIRAKTGTMTGVVSLSGYLYTANGHTLAFAIYINGMPGTSPAISGRYRYLVDALCSFFLKQKPRFHLFSSPQTPQARVAYQQHPPQTALQRKKKAKWRSLESAVKQALKGQSVAVVFRGNELILHDHNPNASKVWIALQNLRKKYVFAVALQDQAPPAKNSALPLLLWIKSAQQNSPRVWKLREAVS